MFFSKKSLTKFLLVISLVLAGNEVGAEQSFSHSLLQINTLERASRLALFQQTDNQQFNTRTEALSAVKDRALIPNSQQFVIQWENGNDTSRAGGSNYVLEKTRQASWGNYYLYKVGTKYFVVAEHINDPDAPFPTGWSKPCKHFHVGTAPDAKQSEFSTSSNSNAAATAYFKSTDYVQVKSPHHLFYKNN